MEPSKIKLVKQAMNGTVEQESNDVMWHRSQKNMEESIKFAYGAFEQYKQHDLLVLRDASVPDEDIMIFKRVDDDKPNQIVLQFVIRKTATNAAGGMTIDDTPVLDIVMAYEADPKWETEATIIMRYDMTGQQERDMMVGMLSTIGYQMAFYYFVALDNHFDDLRLKHHEGEKLAGAVFTYDSNWLADYFDLKGEDVEKAEDGHLN